MKCFSILDVIKNLNSVDFTFSDSSTVTFTANDFVNYLRWKCQEIPYYNNGELKFYNDIQSFNLLWATFNENNRDGFTRIKDALGLTYEVLDNYNGTTTSTDTEQINTNDVLSFSNRLDTQTLSHSDTVTHNTTDTKTLATQNTTGSDPNAPRTTTTAVNEHKVQSHYTTGYNGESGVLEYEDVTTADASGQGINDETVTETGNTISADSGTITDATTGTDTTAHSGTITNGKAGTETNAKTGVITHSFTETKHGNLGVTTSQQMLESEIELRLKYKIKPLIIKSFLDEYFYL